MESMWHANGCQHWYFLALDEPTPARVFIFAGDRSWL